MTLGAAGKKAADRAIAVLGPSGAEKFADAIQTYGEAIDLEALATRHWVKAGKLTLLEQANGVIGVHPAWKAMHEARTMAARFRRDLGLTPDSAKGASGKPQGSASKPDRTAPVTQLRRVQ